MQLQKVNVRFYNYNQRNHEYLKTVYFILLQYICQTSSSFNAFHLIPYMYKYCFSIPSTLSVNFTISLQDVLYEIIKK